MTTHKMMLNRWPLTRRCWIHDHSQEDVEYMTTHKMMVNRWPLTRWCWIDDHSQQPSPANKDCGPVCCSKAPPHNNPHLQTKTAAPCVVPRPPPPHNNPHLQTKTAAPCVVPRPPPPTTTPTCKQRLWPRVLFQGPPPSTTSLLLLNGTNGSYKQRLEPRGTATAWNLLLLLPVLMLHSCCCHYY